MKIEKVIEDVAKKLVSQGFKAPNEIGRVYSCSFRTHDVVTCFGVQDMLNRQLSTMHTDDGHELHVNVIDVHFRKSCEWWCGNVVLCCLPLVACTASDAFSKAVFGPYYTLEVWRRTNLPN
jgi:hypothetical protein